MQVAPRSENHNRKKKRILHEMWRDRSGFQWQNFGRGLCTTAEQIKVKQTEQIKPNKTFLLDNLT